jgi:hypothetical protein
VAEGKRADVIHANNVRTRNGPKRVCPRLPVALKNNGVVVVEAPYVVDMIEHSEFDTIYHEHLCYFADGVEPVVSAIDWQSSRSKAADSWRYPEILPCALTHRLGQDRSLDGHSLRYEESEYGADQMDFISNLAKGLRA